MLLSVLLIACQQQPTDEEKIIGEWYHLGFTYIETFTFNADGTAEFERSGDGGYTENYSWRLSGGKLYLNGIAHSVEVYTNLIRIDGKEYSSSKM